MQSFVYKSRRKRDTYVFLRERDVFDVLPEAIRAAIEPFEFILEIELFAGRRLARDSAEVVMANLERSGFHLQFPLVELPE